MTKIAGLLQKTTKFLKIIFWMEDYEAERGFLILKGDFERKSVKENAPGRVDARLGDGCNREPSPVTPTNLGLPISSYVMAVEPIAVNRSPSYV